MGWFGPRGDCGCCNDPCVCRETGGLQVSVEVNFTEDETNVLLPSLRTVNLCFSSTPVIYIEFTGLMAINGTYNTTLEYTPDCENGDPKIYADKFTQWTTGITMDTWPVFNTFTCVPSCSTFAGSRCCTSVADTGGVTVEYSGDTLTVRVYSLLSTVLGQVFSNGFIRTINCPGLTLPYEDTVDLITGGRDDTACSGLEPYIIGSATLRLTQV